MKPRSAFPPKERDARSKVAQLIHTKPLLLGSLVEMTNTCGKPNCKCASGERHKSWYLSLRYKGKRKMIHIPRVCEEEVFEGIKAYKQVWEQLSLISEETLERIMTSRKPKE